MKMNKWDFLNVLKMQKLVKKLKSSYGTLYPEYCVCIERDPYHKIAKITGINESTVHTYLVVDPDCEKPERFGVYLENLKKPDKGVTDVVIDWDGDELVHITYYHFDEIVMIQQTKSSMQKFMDTEKLMNPENKKRADAVVSFDVDALQKLLTQYSDDAYVTFEIHTGRNPSMIKNGDGSKVSLLLPVVV